jgi:hypothetical protein
MVGPSVFLFLARRAVPLIRPLVGVVSPRKSRVQSKTSRRGIYGGRNDTGTAFFPDYLVMSLSLSTAFIFLSPMLRQIQHR